MRQDHEKDKRGKRSKRTTNMTNDEPNMIIITWPGRGKRNSST